MKVETDNEVALRYLLDSYELVKEEKIISRFKETIETVVDSVFIEVLYDADRKEMIANALSVLLSLSMYLRENPEEVEKRVH